MGIRSRRRGFSLMELTVSLAVSAMLMAALGSAVAIAASALPDANASESLVLESGRAVEYMGADLEAATYLLGLDAESTLFGVADRNGDGAPETVELSWSGTKGGALTLTENTSATTTLLEDVNGFSASFYTRSVIEQYSGSSVSPEETLLDESKGSSNLQGGVYSSLNYATVMRPSLPAHASSWRPTRVEVWLKRSGSSRQTVYLQTQSVDSSGTPTGTELDTFEIDSGDLSSSFTLIELACESTAQLGADESVAIVVGSRSGSTCAYVQVMGSGGSGLWTQQNADPWNLSYSSYQLYFVLHGEYTVPGTDINVQHHFVLGGDIDLTLDGDPDFSISTTPGFVNRPQLLDSIWEADFWSDPTAHDINADKVPDWKMTHASAFGAKLMKDGIVTAPDMIQTNPAKDLSGPVIAEIKWKSHVIAESGVWTLAFDQGGGLQGNLLVTLVGVGSNQHALSIASTDDSKVTHTLATLGPFPADMLETRLLIDPVNDAFSVHLDGEYIGAYPYHRTSYSDGAQVSVLSASGSSVEIDFVRIREGGTP